MRPNRRTVVRARTMGALVASLLLLAAACSSSSKKAASTATSASSGSGSTSSSSSKYPPIPPGPIKLGISLPLSGATAEGGLNAKKAFTQVTMKQFETLHPDGIDGHPVQLDIVDDASDVTKGVSAANQLIADKVAAVITAGFNPEVAAQQFAIFNKAKVPVISQAGDSMYTDTSKWPYMFGISPSVPQEGMASAKWIAKHPEITKLGVLTDGAPLSEDAINTILTPLKTIAPKVQVVKSVTIPAGSVDVSSAVAQLKSAKPDLLLVYVSYGLGPIWQAIQTSKWSPRILSSPLVWYDGFTGMGPLATNAVADYYSCVQPNHAPFPKQLTDLLDGYANAFGTSSVNYLTYVDNDLGPMELMKTAIEKYHSVDPAAVKKALESTNQVLWGVFTYNYTPTNHWGLTSDYAANVCKDTPFSDGAYRVPIVAP